MPAQPLQADTTTAKKLWRQLFLRFFAYALGAMTAGSLVYLFGLELTPRQITIGLLLIAPLAAMLVLGAGVSLLRRQLAPLMRFFALPASERSPLLARQALIRALNLPLLAGARVVFGQGPAFMLAVSLAILAANRWLALGIAPWQWGLCMIGAVLVAVGHGMLEYFATATVLRPYVHHLQVHAGGLRQQDRRRLLMLGTRRKLLLVSAFIVVIPLLVLAFTLLLRMYHLLSNLAPAAATGLMMPLLAWCLLLIAFTAAVSGVMSNALAKEVGDATEGLLAAMQQVEQGGRYPHLYAAGNDEFLVINHAFNRMVDGLREREKLREAFGHYVAHQLVDEVAKKDVRLASKDLHASVLFADIRNFTALAEYLSAAQVIALLNRYFAALEAAIEAEGGWINKFGGDSMLAVFGVLQEQADHVHHAVHAACAMRRRLASFNAGQRESAQPEIRIGMGIHCGRLVAGTIGGKSRMEYTVIGDTVNTAARIQEYNKQWGTDILISEAVKSVVPDVAVADMGEVAIRGKDATMRLYKVL